MRFSILTLASTAASLVSAAPVTFPLANGFPNLNSTALSAVYRLAGGPGIPGRALPKTLTPALTQTLQVIAASEHLEVAFFTELIANITNKVPGYCETTAYDMKTLTAVLAQEQVHATVVNQVLTTSNLSAILPCQYSFPVDSFESAMAYAERLTEVFYGTLLVAQLTLAGDVTAGGIGADETVLVPILGSMLAQEGEQTGYYRSQQDEVASGSPFLTGSTPRFSFTAIAPLILANSCPNLEELMLEPFPFLELLTVPEAKNSTQVFSVDTTMIGPVSEDTHSIVFLSGMIFPTPVAITNVTSCENITTFSAEFPYDTGFIRGLTGAVLANGTNLKFSSGAAVENATIAGPVFFKVDY